MRTNDPGAVIEFKETGRPTFISTTGGRDLPVNGRFWVDERDGTVLRTELRAVDTSVEAHIVVTYEPDAGTGLMVPVRMEERYRRSRDPMEVRGVATYSRFRRFQVSTSEETRQLKEVMIQAMKNDLLPDCRRLPLGLFSRTRAAA